MKFHENPSCHTISSLQIYDFIPLPADLGRQEPAHALHGPPAAGALRWPNTGGERHVGAAADDEGPDEPSQATGTWGRGEKT